MPQIEFAGQSRETETARAANRSRLVNLYREAVPDGGLTRHILRPVPGRVEIADLGSVILRQMAWVDNSVYTVASGELSSVDGAIVTSIGSVEDSPETTISGNAGYVTIVADGDYWVLDGGTLTKPTGAAFSDFGSVETLNNYTLLTERNGRRFQWSTVADPTDLDALDFATTEEGADKNIRGVALNGNYWIFKERSAEIWYPTGVAESAFVRLNGGIVDVGLKGFNLVAKGRDQLFFVGSDNTVYISAGQNITPISTRALERAIKTEAPTHCFYYEQEAHKFCVVRFANRPAWVYDFSTGEWHERAEGVNHDAWNVVATTENNDGTWLTGAVSGEISTLQNIQTDSGGVLYRRAVSPTLRMDSRRFTIDELELFGALGYVDEISDVTYYWGTTGGYFGWASGVFNMGGAGGSEPAIMLRMSQDQGATWGHVRTRGLGAAGQYGKRVLVRCAGQFRTFNLRMDMAHQHEIPIFSDGRLRVS